MDGKAFLHIVLDAYRGEIVSSAGRLEILNGEPKQADGDARGKLVTVRVDSTPGWLEPVAADGWHVRFVGRRRALDARTSDGSLRSIAFDDAGFTVTIDPGDVLVSLGLEPERAASLVKHVLVMPEGSEG